jgi:hypothetical protein
MFTEGFSKTAGISSSVGRASGAAARGVAKTLSAASTAVSKGAKAVGDAAKHQASEFKKGYQAGRGPAGKAKASSSRLLTKRRLLGLGAVYLASRMAFSDNNPQAQQPQYVPPY